MRFGLDKNALKLCGRMIHEWPRVRVVSRLIALTTAAAMAIVSVPSPSSASTILYRENSFNLSAAQSQYEEDLYKTPPHYYYDFPEELQLEVRINKTLFDLKLLAESAESEKSDKTESEPKPPYPKINESIKTVMAGFTAMLLLSKNGFEKALAKEFSVFAMNLLILNSQLYRAAGLPEAKQNLIWERVFIELAQIRTEVTQRLSFQEKQRLQRLMTDLGQSVIDNTYEKDLYAAQDKHLDDANTLQGGATMVTLIFAAMAGTVGAMHGLIPIVESQLSPLLSIPIILSGVAGAAMASGMGGLVAMRAILRHETPYDRNMDRVKGAAGRCLQLLGTKPTT